MLPISGSNAMKIPIRIFLHLGIYSHCSSDVNSSSRNMIFPFKKIPLSCWSKTLVCYSKIPLCQINKFTSVIVVNQSAIYSEQINLLNSNANIPAEFSDKFTHTSAFWFVHFGEFSESGVHDFPFRKRFSVAILGSSTKLTLLMQGVTLLMQGNSIRKIPCNHLVVRRVRSRTDAFHHTTFRILPNRRIRYFPSSDRCG